MSIIILCAFLICGALSENTCLSNQVYMKLSKMSTSYASEESIKIYSGSTLLETTPTLVNNQLRTIEYCLTASTNNQYSIELLDSYGDSWSSGSWVMIEGEYGNRVFKNYLTAARKETYPISLYYAIKKTELWKMKSSSVTGTWTEYSYNDADWSSVTLGSVTATAGPHYFRKTFTGLANMAAYELSMNYRYGIVAYINGAEIFRDNMPEGVPSSSTPASGSYTAVEYRGIIRPGTEAANAQSVLAVEIHFIDNTVSHDVDFDCYMAILASSIDDDSCVIYPYDTTLSSSGSNTANGFDFAKFSYMSITSSLLPVDVTYTFNGPNPYVNGLRVFPYTSTGTAPNSYKWQAAVSSSADFVNVITASGLTYTSSTHQMVNGYFNAGLYHVHRLHVESSSSTSVYIYEAQPMICSIALPTSIVYEPSSYSVYAKFDSVHIQSKITEFSNCQVTPSLPNGVTMNTETCVISGVATAAQPTTTYTVTSVMNGNTYTGTFTLEVTSCAGTLVNVRRTYKYAAYQESFDIKDAATQTVILAVAANSGQESNTNWNTYICLTSSLYKITTGATVSYWVYNSNLFVDAVLGNDSYETIIRAKYDSVLGLPSEYTFNAQFAIGPLSQWHYKMSEVPQNWYSADVSSWSQASAPNFPESTNQIQLYRNTFTVSSVEDVAGLVISLKYQYGVLIYLNGHEAFRKGITGDLSTQSFATTSLTDVKYRQISLPIRTIAVEGAPSVDYVSTTGPNTIAIALVSPGPAIKASTFDCTVRLMGTSSSSRVFEYTYSSGGSGGTISSFFEWSYSTFMYNNACTANHYDIIFNNDRHEWISSVMVKLMYDQNELQPRNFIVKAKNAEDSTWTVLQTVTNLSWSLAGQKNRIWLDNNKAYNQYRVENFQTGDPQNCYWIIGIVDYRSDATASTIPALSYESVTIYKDIEMAEVYPSSEYYKNFTVSPALPTGVTLDAYTGIISGSAHELTSVGQFTVSAKKVTGEAVTATFSFSVDICFGGKNLVTLVSISDSHPERMSYKVYQGKGTSGTLVRTFDNYIATWSYHYGDFCLEHGMYTIEFMDTQEGWEDPGGYFLTVDVGTMKFDVGYVYNNGATPVSVTTMFSSYLPFQIDYDDWKVYKDLTGIGSNWNAIDFDDSTWTVTKAAQIGTSEAITVYIRHDVTLDDVSNYQVLNVRVKYAGGVVAYFNGRKVARFNLIDDFTSETESIEVHDATSFSQFHMVLSTVGAVTGKNVMAFEIHRPKGQSSSEDIVFDATGVFGVNDCSVAVDSLINISGSSPTNNDATTEDFLDIDLGTYGGQPNIAGTFMKWTVENLEGSKFNSFAMNTLYARTGWGFSLYGRENADEEEEWLSMFAETGLSVVDIGRSAWAVPVGIAGFRQFKWEVDIAANAAVWYSSMFLQYCKASGTNICPAVGDFPSVGEGQISPGECDYGFRGYAYRKCEGGSLGEIITDKCVYKIPLDMKYSESKYTVVIGTQTSIPAPTYMNVITTFRIDGGMSLPAGLTLDEKTGAITGIATEAMEIKTYTIYGENPKGATFATIAISVRKGECKADGVWLKTTVGETAVYECSLEGSYVGTQKRECILGSKDGEWQKTKGTCIPIFLLVVVILVAIVIIVVIVLFIIKTTKKTKAVGGVKGKKSKALPSKKSEKTTKAKTVKV